VRIAIASDHGGFRLKAVLKEYLVSLFVSELVDDFGPFEEKSVDYPDYALTVARCVASGDYDLGIMIDGVGIGSTMAANKVRGVRCALCWDGFTARNAREHNHANMLCMGGQVLGDALAKSIVEIFVNSTPAGGRHANRVRKIMDIEVGP
jgi:ribose 5-phosphate isomerase B